MKVWADSINFLGAPTREGGREGERKEKERERESKGGRREGR